MAVEKKSLISSMAAAKKAILASKQESPAQPTITEGKGLSGGRGLSGGKM